MPSFHTDRPPLLQMELEKMDMLWCQDAQNIGLSNNKLKSALKYDHNAHPSQTDRRTDGPTDRRTNIMAIARRLFLWTRSSATVEIAHDAETAIQGHSRSGQSTRHVWLVYINSYPTARFVKPNALLWRTSSLILKRSDMAVLRYVSQGITVLPATHTWTIPAFTPQPQITALWLHGTYCVYPQRDGQAELTCVSGCCLLVAFHALGNFVSCH